jgi:hypothetical protein
MLTLVVPGVEAFDEVTQEFTTIGSVTLELEHSLVSLSKWESEFEKPFLDNEIEKTEEEILGYVKAMNLTSNIPKDVWTKLSDENFQTIHRYIDAKMTATTVYELDEAPKTKKETITAEIVYYWMVSFNIPFECQFWHLNRLFTLIRVCSVKAEKPKKMSQREIARRNRDLNARRKAQLGTKG